MLFKTGYLQKGCKSFQEAGVLLNTRKLLIIKWWPEKALLSITHRCAFQ